VKPIATIGELSYTPEDPPDLNRRETMKRLLTCAAVALLSVTGLVAESNPMIGTWKLNPAKSKYTPGPAPKSQTATIEAAGDGIKNVTQGVAADGSAIAYEYTASTLDGKEYPITGSAPPSGADTIAVKRVDTYTFTSTMKKAGKVVQTNKVVYSKDGKLRTITTKGTNKTGQPTTSVAVYERQ
jgi:hypothetical protein